MTRTKSTQHPSPVSPFAAALVILVGVGRLTAYAVATEVVLAGMWAVAMDIAKDLLDRKGLWDPFMVALGAPSEREIRMRLIDDISGVVIDNLRTDDINFVRDVCREELLNAPAGIPQISWCVERLSYFSTPGPCPGHFL